MNTDNMFNLAMVHCQEGARKRKALPDKV
jgi:hypothetical protein